MTPSNKKIVPLFRHREWWVAASTHKKIIYAEYPATVQKLIDTWDWEDLKTNPEKLYVKPELRRRLFRQADKNLVADVTAELQSSDKKTVKLFEIRMSKQGVDIYSTCGREIALRERRALQREREKKGGVTPISL